MSREETVSEPTPISATELRTKRVIFLSVPDSTRVLVIYTYGKLWQYSELGRIRDMRRLKDGKKALIGCCSDHLGRNRLLHTGRPVWLVSNRPRHQERLCRCAATTYSDRKGILCHATSAQQECWSLWFLRRQPVR